jgi:hypothetical protein
MALDKIIFDDKTLSDLFKEIYNNSRKKDKQLQGMINELGELIEDIQDATLVVPMIKEYMEIGVKNDEHLIKMAQIVQRVEANAVKSGESEFDPLELQTIMEEQIKLSQQIEIHKTEDKE